MRHKYPYIILIFVFLVSAYMVLFNNTEPPTTSSQPQNMLLTTTPAFADYTAAFLIVTNGTQRIFSAPTYHNLSSDVYIERTNPAITHVKKEGIL
ncbi:MAG TPA: hypothetical protein PLD54_04950 [Candidatus Levybacteria bacterium]|nr:hypothetical protein [Candidatus Levybacteria bacterium]